MHKNWRIKHGVLFLIITMNIARISQKCFIRKFSYIWNFLSQAKCFILGFIWKSENSFLTQWHTGQASFLLWWSIWRPVWGKCPIQTGIYKSTTTTRWRQMTVIRQFIRPSITKFNAECYFRYTEHHKWVNKVKIN